MVRLKRFTASNIRIPYVAKLNSSWHQRGCNRSHLYGATKKTCFKHSVRIEETTVFFQAMQVKSHSASLRFHPYGLFLHFSWFFVAFGAVCSTSASINLFIVSLITSIHHRNLTLYTYPSFEITRIHWTVAVTIVHWTNKIMKIRIELFWEISHTIPKQINVNVSSN